MMSSYGGQGPDTVLNASSAGGPGSVYTRSGSNEDDYIESLTVDNAEGQQVK